MVSQFREGRYVYIAGPSRDQGKVCRVVEVIPPDPENKGVYEMVMLDVGAKEPIVFFPPDLMPVELIPDLDRLRVVA